MVDERPNTKYQMLNTTRLLVVVGPTASGKSSLAMELAKLLDGEIICADSRTVYKGLDIGTAKPSKQDRAEVPHHLLDIVEPDQNFTAADFKNLAERAILKIQSRDKLPIIVGGSGLYIDALLFDYSFSDKNAARDANNPRHLSQEVERKHAEMRANTLVIGLDVPRDLLKNRITKRVDMMFENGFMDEVIKIQVEYPGSKALLAPGYKAFSEHTRGHISLEETKALFIKNDYNLAKRQMTWFRRNKNIHWLSDPSKYIDDTIKLLNKLQ